jgi:hypothetical protein
MNRKRLINLVNQQLPNGILCTTDQNSQPNAAVIGSGRMDDQDLFRVALTDNHHWLIYAPAPRRFIFVQSRGHRQSCGEGCGFILFVRIL